MEDDECQTLVHTQKAPTPSLFLKIRPKIGQCPGTRRWFTDGKQKNLRGLQHHRRVQQLISWQPQKKRSFRGRGLPLTVWSCTGSLEGHSFCHQQCNSIKPLAVTLLPAWRNHTLPIIGTISSIWGCWRQESKKKLSLNHRNLSEGKQLSTPAALLYRLKDESCPHNPDARSFNTVVAFPQVFQTAAFTQPERVKPVQRLTEKPLITFLAHAVKGCRS